MLSRRAVWPILVPTGPDNGNSGVCRVLGQPEQNTIQSVALDHPSPPGDKTVIGAAADGQQHFSKQEEKPSCSAQHQALCSALVPGAVQMSPLFLPRPSPLCNNLERREELLCSLPLQPDWRTRQRAKCPGATSGAGLLGLGHRKRGFRRADELLRQTLSTKPSDGCQLTERAPTAFYYCRKQRQSRDQW